MKLPIILVHVFSLLYFFSESHSPSQGPWSFTFSTFSELMSPHIGEVPSVNGALVFYYLWGHRVDNWSDLATAVLIIFKISLCPVTLQLPARLCSPLQANSLLLSQHHQKSCLHWLPPFLQPAQSWLIPTLAPVSWLFKVTMSSLSPGATDKGIPF